MQAVFAGEADCAMHLGGNRGAVACRLARAQRAGGNPQKVAARQGLGGKIGSGGGAGQLARQLGQLVLDTWFFCRGLPNWTRVAVCSSVMSRAASSAPAIWNARSVAPSASGQCGSGADVSTAQSIASAGRGWKFIADPLSATVHPVLGTR